MKRTEFVVDKMENFLGGEGLTTIERFITGDEFYGKGRMFAQFIIEKDASVGVHKHDGEQEIYYITQGKGEYVDDGEVYEIGVGDVLICKDGSSHGIKNIGDTQLKYTALILFTTK